MNVYDVTVWFYFEIYLLFENKITRTTLNKK